MSSKMSDLPGTSVRDATGAQDKEKPMDLDRAKAVAEIGQTIINSAKVEVDYLKVTGQGPAHTKRILSRRRRLVPASNGKPALSVEGKNCHDCRGEQKEYQRRAHFLAAHPSVNLTIANAAACLR